MGGQNDVIATTTDHTSKHQTGRHLFALTFNQAFAVILETISQNAQVQNLRVGE